MTLPTTPLTLVEIARALGACENGTEDALYDFDLGDAVRLADVDGLDWSQHPERAWIDLVVVVARATDEGTRAAAVLAASPHSSRPCVVGWYHDVEISEGIRTDLIAVGGCDVVHRGVGCVKHYGTGDVVHRGIGCVWHYGTGYVKSCTLVNVYQNGKR
jgi:hypothetical protein